MCWTILYIWRALCENNSLTVTQGPIDSLHWWTDHDYKTLNIQQLSFNIKVHSQILSIVLLGIRLREVHQLVLASCKLVVEPGTVCTGSNHSIPIAVVWLCNKGPGWTLQCIFAGLHFVKLVSRYFGQGRILVLLILSFRWSRICSIKRFIVLNVLFTYSNAALLHVLVQ